MCLIVLAWRCRNDAPLIVAANRDEQFDRPAAPAHWWPTHPALLAGKDLLAGGTWLGMNETGHFAALTNFRDPARVRPHGPSRGLLVRDALLGTDSTPRTLQRVAADAHRYTPFTLLYCDGHTLGAYESASGTTHELPPGVYGLSNHLLDTPWPKLKRAREHFQRIIETPDLDTGALFSLLRDDERAADAHLPDTGLTREREREMSSIFIHTADYGTRCSTVIVRSRTGTVRFQEKNWRTDATLARNVVERFHVGNDD